MLYSRQICRYSSRYTLFTTYVVIHPNIRSIYDKYVIIPLDIHVRFIHDKYVVILLDICSNNDKYVDISLKYTLYSRQICRYSSKIYSIHDKYVVIPLDIRSIHDKYVVIPLDIHSIHDKYVVIPLKYTLFTTNMSLFL